jgi:hypothetical protein
MNRKILLASFILPERLDWFLNYLETKFSISKDTVFIYKNHDDESKLIVTFKFTIKDDKRINFKTISPNTILIHKKGNAIYTINALNKLIESTQQDNIGNIDHKSVIINWDEYQNNLILTNDGELVIFSIEKVF